MERMMKWCYERYLDTGSLTWLHKARKYRRKVSCPCDGCQWVARRIDNIVA